MDFRIIKSIILHHRHFHKIYHKTSFPCKYYVLNLDISWINFSISLITSSNISCKPFHFTYTFLFGLILNTYNLSATKNYCSSFLLQCFILTLENHTHEMSFFQSSIFKLLTNRFYINLHSEISLPKNINLSRIHQMIWRFFIVYHFLVLQFNNLLMIYFFFFTKN